MNNQSVTVKTRMAPSPTGLFHVGGVRTALYNYLFAKQNNGRFALRIEDTDKERSKKEYEKNIFEAFEWLGLTPDEVVRQSERIDIHKKYLEQLIASGHAYEGEVSKDGSGNVIRFKNPNKKVTVHDLILGDIEVDTTDLGDFVIARNKENPVYHFVVVADDHDMGITHVIRAQEHLANTPRQILIGEALGFTMPVYSHIPLVLAPDKSKMSKRHGSVAVTDYRDQGYLPEALINFLALIGWNPGGDQEILTLDELIEKFDLTKVQKGGGVFNIEKLNWINKEWLARMSDKEFSEYIREAGQSLWSQSEEMFQKLIPMIRERIHTSSEFSSMIDAGEFDYFFQAPAYTEPEKIIWKKSDANTAKEHLAFLSTALETATTWDEDSVKSLIWTYAEEKGKGDVLWPLRYALSGREKSPDPLTLAVILGKETTLQRIQQAQEAL